MDAVSIEFFKHWNILNFLAYTYKEKIRREIFYMEYAKDEVFQIRYSTKLNRLEMTKEGWTSRTYQRIKRHKLLTTVVIAFFTFATINFFMICNFMKILQNV